MVRTPTQTTTTMSNSNTNALALALAPRNRDRSYSTARNSYGMKTVYIKKDMQPVTLAKMKSVNNPSFQKAACFGTLFDTVFSLVYSHSVAGGIVESIALP